MEPQDFYWDYLGRETFPIAALGRRPGAASGHLSHYRREEVA